MNKKHSTKQATENSGSIEVHAVVSPAIFTAMWPNQPVKVCAEHAQQLTNVGSAIGLQVPLLPYIGEDDCINCVNEAKQD